jgi:ferric-dicitrate binding protein FerR (iron transport regulator)
MKSEEFKSLLEKYVRGECTLQEEQLINEWYENIETSEEDTAPLLSELSNEYRQAVEDRIWAKVNPQPHRSRWRYVLRIAAALVLISTSAVLIIRFGYDREPANELVQTSPSITPAEDQQEHITNNGSKPFSLQLPDGSQVELQPRSEIVFDKNFDKELREVKLSGEAQFNVRRDEKRPFRVYSEEVVTQVLGTSFIVKAYQNDKEVTVAVKSGKVSVYATHDVKASKKDESPIILAPNQRAVYNRNDNKVIREVVQHPEIILPKSDLFKMSFEETPVAAIFDVLKENYGIDIVYNKETLTRCTITTAMSDEGLFERIEVICKAINATYRVHDGVILIESPGCD